MKKTTRQRVMNREPTRQRKLELSRETVRMLGNDELSRAVGGAWVATLRPWTSDKHYTSRR